MTTIIIECFNSIVGQQVTVVEEQTVDTQTVGQFELVRDVPLILSINTRAVELNTCSRFGLTIVTIGQTEDLWCAIEQSSRINDTTNIHIIGQVVTIVTRTITHILVVGHLMLEGHTGHNLMRAHVIGHVILDVPDSVMNGIVPCEQLVTESHVVITVTCNINEGELGRVSTTYVVELRDGSQELVGEVLRQTAVQVE